MNGSIHAALEGVPYPPFDVAESYSISSRPEGSTLPSG